MSGAPGVLLDKLVHLQRPNSRDLEANLHLTADDSTPTRGLLALVNPTAAPIARTLVLPLWYAGLKPGAIVHVGVLSIGGEKNGTDAHRVFLAGESGVDSRHVVGSNAKGGCTDIVVTARVGAASYGVLELSLAPEELTATATAPAR